MSTPTRPWSSPPRRRSGSDRPGSPKDHEGIDLMPDPRPELSIVLPCYNEAENLPPLLGRYAQVWEDLPAELILVDNGSTDHTEAVLRRELPNHPFARTVKVEKNQGYGHGIMTGLRAARGEFLAFSHADQQSRPDDVFAAYHRLKSAPNPRLTLVKGL